MADVIRAQGTIDGDPLIVVGLSAENVARLKKNNPIMAVYPDGSTRVLVVYGETEDDVTKDLRALGWLP